MKTFPLTAVLFTTVSFFLGLSSYAAPTPGGGGSTTPGSITFQPDAKTVQGNQPLSQSYPLVITSPANLPVGVPTSVNVVGSILSKDTTVPDETVLSFLSITPAQVTFTGPNQEVTVTVAVNVPLGQYAGNYAYEMRLQGWPTGINVIDKAATVNALVSPPLSEDTGPPTVTLQIPVDGTIYTYYPATGNPVNVPIVFEGNVGEGGAPITGMQAYINNQPVSVSSTGIGTLTATGNGSVDLTEPGTYNVRVLATNLNGNSEDQGDFTVEVSAPPPVITVASPTPGANFTFPAGSTGVSIPVSYTATSIYGNITATGATLNGQTLTLSLNGVGSDLVANGSVSMDITTPGSYTLQFTASNAYGNASPVVVPFSVSSYEPLPTVTIVTPEDGAVITRTQGDPATAVEFAITGGTEFGSVESVTVLLDGTPVSASINGLGTTSITGSFTGEFAAAGTHTLTVTLDNGFSTATDTTTITVQEQSAEICADLTWLPPISLNKTIQGGSVMPIKFTLRCQGEFVRDETVLISIYEILPDGTMTDPVIYPYGTGSPNPAEYAITGPMYHLNYTTAEGEHRYRIEVYRPLDASGTSLQLLGTKDLLTRGDDKDCKSDKSSKSGKSYKSSKSGKSEKSDKSLKSNKSDKSDKSTKSDKGGKSDKSDKSSKSVKYSTGNPGNHKSVGGAGEQPDGRDNWGSGDKGKSNGKSDKNKTSSKYPSKR